MEGWTDGRTDGWMDGWMSRCLSITACRRMIDLDSRREKIRDPNSKAPANHRNTEATLYNHACRLLVQVTAGTK